MLNKLHIAYIILNIVILVQSKGIYTVLAPGTLRSFFNYNVGITVHDAEGPCEIQVSIFSSTYNTTKVINMMPMSTENVEFEIPKLERDDYRLLVKGVSGIIFENSTHVIFEDYDPLGYIQINKPIFNPGDLVQYRVVLLNPKTHPEQLKKPVTIIIKDGNDNVIKQSKNVNLTSGVYTGDFRISEYYKRGWWQIEVLYGKNVLQSKKLGVIKYDLPIFEVILDGPQGVDLEDEVVRITVTSKYSYGKPVRGKVTVEISFWPTYLTDIEHPEGGETIRKTFPTDGKGHAEFNIKDLPRLEMIFNENDFPLTYNLNAYVEEELTGRKQYASSSSFELYKHNVIIKALKSNVEYNTGELITYTVVGQKFDGSPVQDQINVVELKISEFSFYSTFNESGMATFRFVIQNEYLRSRVFCKHLGKEYEIDFILVKPIEEIPQDRFQISIKTQIPQLKKDLLIEVKWTEQINYFVYNVVGRGNSIILEQVEVPSGTQSYLIKIKPTFEMLPEANIFVHYIHNDNLRFEEIDINFEEDFQNILNISATAGASPGDDVEITISTDPNSYVGLLGIDQRILFYGNDHDFKKHQIFGDLLKYKTKTPYIRGGGRYPGVISGLVSLTNAHFPWNNYWIPPQSSGPNFRDPVPRTRFPETWIFDNFDVTNQTQYSIVRKVPDTITSWVITGFSMNSNTGFALTTSPTKIQVFKPFFITIHLPYSVKLGEIIAIPVLVFNYMDGTADTEVTMDNSDKEFDFIEAINEVDERSVNKMKEHKRIAVEPDRARSVSFLIKPKIVGILTLKVTALTTMAGDIVHQSLKVESEGVTQHQNRALFIQLNDTQEQKEAIMVDIPGNIVSGSEHVEISAVGDIIGLSIKYIENLVRLPDGFGEQNMINFVSSILALKYLQTVDRKMPNVTKTARNILKIGYLLELAFKHRDGSYSAYGSSDRNEIAASSAYTVTGSTWLTAYVARYFQQASEFIEIDQGYITESLEFLLTKQTANGNFAEFGFLFEHPHLNDVSLSAFVLLAFMESKENFTKYESSIKKGISYLIRSVDDTDDIYSLSITAFVLQKANHQLADEVLAKLKSFAKSENGFTWWMSKEKRAKRRISAFKSSDIEITSYALLAMLEKGPTEDVLPIIKWLTMQRNSHGGFTTTQDTVVGLQALTKFAEKTGLSRTGSMDIDFICEGIGVEDKGTINIRDATLLMLNIHELPKKTRRVTFSAKGNISSLVQLSYSYNTIDKEPRQSLRLSVNVKNETPPQQLILDICAQFVPTDIDVEGNKTNMIVIEVVLPSGHTIGREDLEKIRDFRTILFTETQKSGTVAIIYLHSLEVGNKQCLSVEATKEHEVAKQKPVPVIIYDFYDKERRATEYYEVKSSLCDICEGDDCSVGCKNSNGTLSMLLENDHFH